MTFAQKLKELRTRAGMSQEKLAEKVGVSRQAITKWETDKGAPDMEVKVAMLEKYPNLKRMYDPDDGNTQVLYFAEAQATFASFAAPPETVEL